MAALAAPLFPAPLPPTPGVGRRAMPAALVVSVAAHGLAAGLLLVAWRDTQAPTTIGRTRGALQVSLRPAAPVVTRPQASPAPRRAAVPVAPARTPSPQKTPARKPPKAEPVLAAAPPAALPSPAPEARPGARFASLFAPIVQAPLGRGGWGHARPAAAPPADARAQREQALMQLHTALRTRLAALAEQLRQTDHTPACDLVVDAEHRVAQVNCTAAQDQAFAWAPLQGLLSAGTVADAAERLCFRVAERQVVPGPCPGSTTLP